MRHKINKLSIALVPIALSVGCLAIIPNISCSTFKHVKHIAPYLHEITLNDYTYDKDFITTKEAEAFGCSSVRNGNFYGRNFDYVFNDTPEFIVRVKANQQKQRHESIGVATHFGLRESKLLKNEYNQQLDLIPNVTLDGINDAGVICSHNVVSMEPNEVDGHQYDPQTNPNNANALNLHMLFVPRYVLDHASSAKNAIELLKSDDINIMGNLNNHYNLHIMIADANETYVVEFFHLSGQTHNHFDVVAQKKTGNEQIMTNYYVNNGEDENFVNDTKNGYERYEILKDGYDSANSFAGMEALMRKVIFTNAYRFTHNIVPYGRTLIDQWGDDIQGDLSSEWYSEIFDKSIIYDENIQNISEIKPFLDIFNNLKSDFWLNRILNVRSPANPMFWQTTHNSTYDIENKHLRVVVQEQYESYFDYYL